jgi:hypothetical protein
MTLRRRLMGLMAAATEFEERVDDTGNLVADPINALYAASA